MRLSQTRCELPGKAPCVTLAYVEFDDNGELFEREQLDAAVGEVNRAVHGTDGADVVVFIHGWKNDADNSSNVSGFQRFLRVMHVDPARRPLVGVYLAWRGSSLRIAQNLTYWNRTMAATRVGGPHFEEALLRLIRTVKAPSPPVQPESSLVVIGHSFGGRVLEHALTPYLETIMLDASASGRGSCVKPSDVSSAPTFTVNAPLPDLTVLLNEAAPATDAKALLETLTCHNAKYVRRSRAAADAGKAVAAPLLLSMTSDGDAATGVALPGGQFLARSQLKTRKYERHDDAYFKDHPWEGPADIGDQADYFTHTTAHIPALHSHQLRHQSCPAGAVAVIPVHGQGVYYLCQIGTAMHTGEPYWNHTPYWVFKIPIEIVPDHEDVFRKELFDLIQFMMPSPHTVGELTVQ